MPCCAFAAVIIGQFLLMLRAVKRAVLGQPNGEATENPTVEWRLDPASVPAPVTPRPFRLRGRRAIGGLALAAAIELLLVLGAVYGVVEHFGHGAGHAGHMHAGAHALE